MVELIGEEIYDEFDAQGARGDPYEIPYIQAPRTEDKARIPNTWDSANDELQTSSGPDGSLPVASRRMSIGGLQIPKPLKGFDIFALRSHSAPPVPRDGSNSANLGTEIAHVSGKSNTVSSEDKVTKVVDVALPTAPKEALHSEGRAQSRPPSRGANLELTKQGGLMSSSNDAEGPTVTINETTKIIPTSYITSPQKQFGASTPATLLSTPSPASSLEAILLDRKRRIQAHGSTPAQGTAGNTSGTVTRILASPVARPHDRTLPNALPSTTCDDLAPAIPRPSSAPISKVKGTRFKSSRLDSSLMGTRVLPMEESQDGLAEENIAQD